MINDDKFIKVGKIIGVHGLNGRLKIIPISDIVSRFKTGKELYLKKDTGYEKMISAGFTEQRGKASLLKLEGISDRNNALLLEGIEIYIKKEEAERTRSSLGEDCYYYYDIIGCRVNWKGNHFGEVIDIVRAGEGDVLVIKSIDTKEFMIPFIQSMVDTSNIFEKMITIDPVEGLIVI